jgi:murein DD-endopeptidase MepM/ murein hydrolase activator NlpD
VMSSFADQRTYVYEGREVDHQVHLGYDLASVARSPVPAANRGIVRMAGYFGIYGNAVVVDHGHGLMTLYAHLSSLDVSEGAEVQRGQVLGRTGATGLAGGDHLHFTTLVGGLPVDPTEWWDPAWIRDRVARKLGGALPFAPPPGRR